MNTSVVSERIAEESPRLRARIAGGLWLIVIGASGYAAFAVLKVIVRGDAAATATNILASQSLLRFGFVGNLLASVCYLGVSVLLYDLLKPVSRILSLFAACCGLVGVAIGAATSLNYLAPLILLGGGQYSTLLTASQLQAMALMSLKMSEQGNTIAMFFFGFQCISIGYLIVRSTFLPRILGVLLAIGGSSYVISSFASFLFPAFGAQLLPFIIPLAIIGEGSLTLWLLVAGLNARRWKEQASAARQL